MTNHDTRTGSGRARGRLARWALVLAFMVPAAGCDILDVDNPNNLTQEQLNERTAATSAVNGGIATVTRGLGEMSAPYSTLTDELTWIGSRDAWSQLDRGNIDDPANEFVDDAFTWFSEGRWMIDEAVDLVRGHLSDESTPEMQENLVRALIWKGIQYIAIGDMMEDYAFSDRMEAGPAVGPGNMGTAVYQPAIDALGEAITVAQSLDPDVIEDADVHELRATALRARALHAQAVWNYLHGMGAGPLVTAGAADAATVVADQGFSDWTFDAEFSAATVASDLGFQVNNRGELQLGTAYVTRNVDDSIDEYIFMDPITGEVDVRMRGLATAFLAGGDFPSMIQVSNREMHLILAEEQLANGNVTGAGGFMAHINHVRVEITDEDPYTGPGQLAPMVMLEHERRANLYLQNRRLADHYRFGTPSPEWDATSVAASNMDVMLPITCIEIRANENLSAEGC